MKKLFFNLFLLWTFFFVCCYLFGIESRQKDGVIEYAYGQVGGKVYWTQKEYENALSVYNTDSSTGAVVTFEIFVLTDFEKSVDKKIGAFKNYEEYKKYEEKNK